MNITRDKREGYIVSFGISEISRWREDVERAHSDTDVAGLFESFLDEIEEAVLQSGE